MDHCTKGVVHFVQWYVMEKYVKKMLCWSLNGCILFHTEGTYWMLRGEIIMLTKEDMNQIKNLIKEQDTRIDQIFKEQDAHFDQKFREQDSRIDQKFKEQDARIDQKFERMETRLMDMIDHRFHQQQLYLENNFGAAFQSLKEYLPPTGKTYSGLEGRVDFLETRTNDGYTILKQHEQRLDSIERIVGQGVPTLVSDRSAE